MKINQTDKAFNALALLTGQICTKTSPITDVELGKCFGPKKQFPEKYKREFEIIRAYLVRKVRQQRKRTGTMTTKK